MRKLQKYYTVMLLGTLLCMLTTGCGGGVDEDAQDVAKWVLGIGGKLKTTDSDLTIKKIEQIPQGKMGISYININEKEHKAIDLQKIAGLKNITYLGLHSSPISDNTISHITGLKTLEELELSNTQITDDGLIKIAEELPNLKKIFLYDTAPGITDEGIKKFKAKTPQCKVNR